MSDNDAHRPRPGSLIGAALLLLALLAGANWAIGRWIQSPSNLAWDPRFGFVRIPHSRIVQSLEGWSENRTNSLGLFDDELRPERPRLRVLVLGDSYAEGLQISHAENFTTVTERLLPGVEVVNAAGSGRFPAHYAAYLPKTWEAIHPDRLVIQVNDGDVNELADPKKLREVQIEAEGRSPFAIAEANANRTLLGRLRGFVKRAALVRYLNVRLQLLDEHERARFAAKFDFAKLPEWDDTAGPIPPRSIAAADSLFEVIRRVAPDPIVVYIPFMDYYATPPRPMYPLRRQFWHDLAARHGLTLIDPADDFTAEFQRTHQFLHGFSNSTIGRGHINARGHALLGRLLADRLREELAAAPPATPAAGAGPDASTRRIAGGAGASR